MYLQKIVDRKRSDPTFLASQSTDWAQVCKERNQPTVAFSKNLRNLSRSGRKLIAEMKRASPSKGSFQFRGSVEERVSAYQRGGAAAISILTEEAHFCGSLADLTAARQACELPLLRKDFLLEPWEVAQARAYGADAVLLIACLFTIESLNRLRDAALEHGVEVLLEVHSSLDLELALSLNTPPEMIGINNRNLETFEVDLKTTEHLAPAIPESIVKISESGFATREDLERFDGIVDAFLVGETLMRTPTPESILADWISLP